ncbi:E3 ubiquitin-protein ligase At1g12760 isoform X2 [Cajanus cajan]|uniref:RING-type E3 ubiquitin transferase n=1 Tax=Cajanus cajan TaxID=3821 RepID=A0A151SLF5_CAJCA|nr:E3 ubiquitin-protein ligase At1g12760 isoform X2 [Cajanus cajan]KYP55605.1 E3 ubiquitin-protein ligase At4g11680 family [Cajanus cajan]
MATARSPNRSSEDAADPTPFIGTSSDDSTSGRRLLRRPSLREAARFLRQASGRRLMREPSMVVREAAAEQLEERQSDWAYSKPVVVLDVLWNFAFVVAAATVMVLSRNENPNMPLRLWIVGYALQCVLHVACVLVEYQRRQRRREQSGAAASIAGTGVLSSASLDGSGQYVSLAQFEDDGVSMAKHLESANTMFSFIWWVVGFYWVSADSQALVQESPMLYWLCIVFLGFDVFFVVFCIALACIIGIAVCCCLPCIIALLYAVADQEGASKEDIEQLSKFKFQRTESIEKLAGNTQETSGGIMTECNADSPIEHVLSDEDAECCICLSAYDDGVELRQLPCGHHFHCACVDKWLYINATCPLCKYNILKSTSHAQDEV